MPVSAHVTDPHKLIASVSSIYEDPENRIRAYYLRFTTIGKGSSIFYHGNGPGLNEYNMVLTNGADGMEAEIRLEGLPHIEEGYHMFGDTGRYSGSICLVPKATIPVMNETALYVFEEEDS